MFVQNVTKFVPVRVTLIFLLTFTAAAQRKVQKTNNFDSDPGWEGYNNRVACSNCPEISQDFGWRPTNKTGGSPGEIGGTIWRSTTPAYYAMPVGPYSFEDEFSASGKLAVYAPDDESVGFYIGFFNAERQGWRVWSSCGFRISEVKQNHARFHLDYKTGRNKGAILNPDIIIPCDGSVHTWELIYEPDLGIDKNSWPHPKLPAYIGRDTNTHEDDIYARAKADNPEMTREELHNLLLQARDAGLVDHWYRKGTYHLWEIERNADNMKGRITFKFDNYSPVSYFLLPGHREEPSIINRFGIYNMQIYTGSMEFYVSELIVNGQEIELLQDPHWDGLNNQVTFRQTDFHARENFGYTQTNWAGGEPGEIGGRFYGTEVEDPLHGYYADDIGNLTLDDTISFSGKINFVKGAVDGRMLIGYFNRAARLADISGEYKGNPPHQFMGIEIMDQTQLGYSFTAVCSPRQDKSFEERGPIIIPDRIRRTFRFFYNPQGGEHGLITITLDGESFSADLSAEQRRIGANFDRFGLLNPRKGGKYVDLYFDDLTYDARYPEGHKPVFHKQETVYVPYPPDGRLYK